MLREGSFDVPATVRLHLAPDDEPSVNRANRYSRSALLSWNPPTESDFSRSETLAPRTERLIDGLVRWRAGSGTDGNELCLMFDQFEELITTDPTDLERKIDFIQELTEAVDHFDALALFSLREEFLGPLTPWLGSMPSKLRSQYRLDRLNADAARTAIERTAGAVGVTVDAPACHALIDDLRMVRVQRGGTFEDVPGPYVEPVQLQVVCRQLWTRLDPDAKMITIHDVQSVGNTDHALARFYDAAVYGAAIRSSVREQDIRSWIGDHLITEAGFRAQVTTGPSGTPDDRVLRELENSHVLRAQSNRGTVWYELVHDRLIRPIMASNEPWWKARRRVRKRARRLVAVLSVVVGLLAAVLYAAIR